MKERLQEALRRLSRSFYARLDRVSQQTRNPPHRVMEESLKQYEKNLDNDKDLSSFKGMAAVREFFRRRAMKTAKKMTAEKRSERGRKGAEARWKKAKSESDEPES